MKQMLSFRLSALTTPLPFGHGQRRPFNSQDRAPLPCPRATKKVRETLVFYSQIAAVFYSDRFSDSSSLRSRHAHLQAESAVPYCVAHLRTEKSALGYVCFCVIELIVLFRSRSPQPHKKTHFPASGQQFFS